MTAKGDRANELLNDPLIEEAFANVKHRLMQLFQECENDPDTLRDIKVRLTLLEAVKQDLQNTVDQGVFEDFQAAEEERLKGGEYGKH